MRLPHDASYIGTAATASGRNCLRDFASDVQPLLQAYCPLCQGTGPLCIAEMLRDAAISDPAPAQYH